MRKLPRFLTDDDIVKFLVAIFALAVCVRAFLPSMGIFTGSFIMIGLAFSFMPLIRRSVFHVLHAGKMRYLIFGCMLPVIIIILMSLIYGVSYFGLSNFLQWLINGEYVKKYKYAFYAQIFLHNMALGIINGVAVELTWRAFMFNALEPYLRNTIKRAIVIGLFYFIWEHIINKGLNMIIFVPFSLVGLCVFIINACLVSIIYCWLFKRSGTIWPGVFSHALNYTLNIMNVLIGSVIWELNELVYFSGAINIFSYFHNGSLFMLSYIIIICSIIKYDKKFKEEIVTFLSIVYKR